ncbi:hypothetical protein WJ968_04270 [Achromobacter xylosoxidans]
MMQRRTLLKLVAGLPAVAAAPALAGRQGAAGKDAGGKTYVLAHGSWHGGWCWR